MNMHTARYFITILFVMIFSVVKISAQGGNSRKALKYMEKAQEFYQQGDWSSCEDELLRVMNADSSITDSYLMLGDVYQETGRSEEAVQMYKRALGFNPEHEDIVLYLLGNTLFSLERYSEALDVYEHLLVMTESNVELRASINNKKQIAEVRKSLMDNPVSFDPVNLGPMVNTTENEYINALSADGSGIYFTRRLKNEEDASRDFSEDLYHAGRTGDSLQCAIKLDYPPGKDNDAGALCISPDGRLIFFTSCFRQDSYGSCDLYYAEKKGDTWSEAKNMGRDINSASWDAQPSFAPDGKTLYFTSNRAGGYGSSDIWKTERTADGEWGKPVNLGLAVNTIATEMAPFIHFDNQTLYFSSSGHPGMGGTDLYKSTRIDGKWSPPENLGYPINSDADELVVIVDPAGEQGYISTNSMEGEGGYDMFRFELHNAIRPIPVSYLKGKVYDKVSGLPLEARFELIDIALDSIIIDALSDRQSGEFLVCLPGNRTYALNVSSKGYLFYSEHFPFTESKTSLEPVLKNIPLEPIAVGKSIILRNIFYETGQYQLKSLSFAELDKLVKFLSENPDLRVEIGGHTDDVGSLDANLTLSLNRAEAVFNYLIENGITTDRITYKGYGEGKPVSPNDSDQGRALNRRTEITVID